jgi:hypothetical protein
MVGFDYSRVPIDSGRKEIRLLDVQATSVQPGIGTSPNLTQLRCVLRKGSLVNCPPFQALSYVWGDEKDRKTISLAEDLGSSLAALPVHHSTPQPASFSISVTSNLESALCHLQREDEIVTLWVDALCINQDDVREKNTQVQMMKDIYENAERVIVWLGTEADDSNVAFQLLRALGEGEQATNALAYRDAHRSMPEPPVEYVQFRKFCTETAQNISDHFPLEAIRSLTLRPWWERIWVVQELVLGRDVVFVCGHERLGVRALAAASMTLTFVIMDFATVAQPSIGDFTQHPEKVARWQRIMDNIPDGTMGRMLGLRRRFQGETRPFRETLLDLLYSTNVVHSSSRRHRSTLAKDRIYGLLGMAVNAEKLHIVPDYSATVPTQDTYTRAAYSMLEHGFVDLLLLNQFPKQLTDLPSWVPDWTSVIRTPIGGRKAEAKYNACGNTTFFISMNRGSTGEICLKGAEIDRISEVGTPWDPSLDDYSYEWETLISYLADIDRFCNLSNEVNSQIYSCLEQRQDAHWRVPTADSIITDLDPAAVRSSQSSADLKVAYQALREYLPQWKKVGSVDDVVNSYMRVLSSLFRRRPFLTTQGYVGLGPLESAPGDSVWIISGVHVPYALRPIAHSKFSLLGECYVHGLMDGEFTESDYTDSIVTVV